MSKKVLIGMSGGVDSAVACYLLKKQGYDVTACFMRNWDSITNNDINGNPTLEGSKCSQELDYDDALKVCDELGVKLLRVDFIEEYWNYVFSKFIDTYKRAYTPNPDVFCNKYIKFDAFSKFAKDNGFDYIAMGHYAKLVEENGIFKLMKADDRNKDQSYFLCHLSQEQLSNAIFPLAYITKEKVREIANKLNLIVAKKKDSTGVCFIGERHFKEFLSNYLPSKKGKIVNMKDGMVVGEHSGVLFYTVGQRKGLYIGGIKGNTMDPYFVVGKDVEKNILYVSQEHDNNFRFSSKALLTNMNYIFKFYNEYEKMPLKCKFRYRSEDKDVIFEYIDKNSCYLYYDNYPYITKGQIAVLYNGDICLGGGEVEKIFDAEGKEILY